jgi:uncharacterized membrane protein YfcA
MDLLHIALLAGTGIVAGAIASLVGGAAVVVYPALIATGLTPQVAAMCNLTALTPASMAAALSDRSQLPPFNGDFVRLLVFSVIGSGLGAALLLLTPDRLFSGIVPVLLGFATVLFAYADRINAYLRERAARRGRAIGFKVSSLKMLLPVSFYGGYFGAGLGIMLLGVFSLATGGDYRAANVTKNLVSSLNGMVAATIFISQGAVVWPQTLSLMAGMIGGGLIGAHIARVIPRRIVRVLIVLFGAALTVAFARRYWF